MIKCIYYGIDHIAFGNNKSGVPFDDTTAKYCTHRKWTTFLVIRFQDWEGHYRSMKIAMKKYPA